MTSLQFSINLLQSRVAGLGEYQNEHATEQRSANHTSIARLGAPMRVSWWHDTVITKHHCTRLGSRVANRCPQIHGGLGLSTDVPIEKICCDTRSSMIIEGPAEVPVWRSHVR